MIKRKKIRGFFQRYYIMSQRPKRRATPRKPRYFYTPEGQLAFGPEMDRYGGWWNTIFGKKDAPGERPDYKTEEEDEQPQSWREWAVMGPRQPRRKAWKDRTYMETVFGTPQERRHAWSAMGHGMGMGLVARGLGWGTSRAQDERRKRMFY